MVKDSFDLALQYHQAGRLREAEQLYQQILAADPKHADAMQNLGVLALQYGRSDIAVTLFRRTIAINPHLPQAHSNLGNALLNQRQLGEAIAAYRQAIILKPDYAEALANLGVALKESGQRAESIAACLQAIEIRPDCVEGLYNLGIVYYEDRRFADAIAKYRQAISLRPQYTEAHNNLGLALQGIGQLDEAIAEFREATLLEPKFALAHFNLANAYRDKKEIDLAIACYRQAIQINPNSAESHSNLASVLKDRGAMTEALFHFRRAISLNPNLAQAHSNLVYALHYSASEDAALVAVEYLKWNALHAEPLRKHIQPHFNCSDSQRRLRVGYVSPDFRNHVVARNVLPLLRQHDRRQVEVFCYGHVDRSDAMTDEFCKASDRWSNIFRTSDEDAARQIREDKIDILVDLALHTGSNRLLLFARKPAPVQVTFAGYPGSTGLSTIDYRLSDPYLDPPGMDESIYSEKTIRLPDSFWCYDPLECADVPTKMVREPGALTFGCLNNFCKINDITLALWAQVLQQLPGSRLLLLAEPGSHREATLEYLSQYQVNPRRVEFVPHQPRREYLRVYDQIDIGLDTFPYNGHTTSLDSFWMGVPVVTLVGQTAVSRAGWSQLSNLALTELAGSTKEDFIRIAVELATNLPRLRELQSSLRTRMQQSPLMDAPKFARNIEAAYRKMWHTWCGSK